MTVLENLKSRHFDMNVHTVWIDEDEGVATYPLWNLTGQMVGYQQYRPSATKKKDNHPRESRYFSWRKDKVVGVWGLESWSFSNTLFITEGVFDAARLTARGYSAIATLSNDVDPPLARWLWVTRKNRPVVAICDGDVAGRKLAKLGHCYHVMTEGKDMGEASDEYVTNFLKDYK
jgi:hypothetical protein